MPDLKTDKIQEDEKPTPTELTEATSVPDTVDTVDTADTADTAADESTIKHDNKNTTFLRPSPSETSLTRSRSLSFPPKPKHSPDCKDNPYKL